MEKKTLTLLLGIGSLCFSTLGVFMFGVIGGLIAIVLGVVALVFAIDLRKASDNQEGTAALICGIIGLVFGIFFSLTCAFCSCGLGCYGCVGTSCQCAACNSAANSATNELLNELNK